MNDQSDNGRRAGTIITLPEGADPFSQIEPGLYYPAGSAIWDVIGQHERRFYERLMASTKLSDLVRKGVVNNGIFANKDQIRLRVKGIDEYRFVFGRDEKGTGRGGDGDDDGDGSGDSNDSSPGKGGGGEHYVEVILSPEQYEDALFAGLELPNMLKKKGGPTEIVGLRLEGLGPSGSRVDLDRRETYKRWIRRAAALSVTRPDLIVDGRLDVAQVPIIGADRRYWQFGEVREEQSEAVLVALMDRSPSVSKVMLEWGHTYFRLKFRFLKRMYKHVTVIMIAHGTEPVVCQTEEEFLNAKVDTGTRFESSLRLILDLARQYDSARYNLYLDQVSDGDMMDDSSVFMQLYRELLELFNFITYIDLVDPNSGWGASSPSRAVRTIQSIQDEYLHHIFWERVRNLDGIFDAFARSLRKDAARTGKE